MIARPQKKDEEEEEEAFSVQVLNFLDDQIEVDRRAQKKDKTKEVKHYAVNEMKVANRINTQLYSKKNDEFPKEIKCAERVKMAQQGADLQKQRDVI